MLDRASKASANNGCLEVFSVVFKAAKRKRPDSWTIEEFEAVRDGFLKGKRIKVIADELGRTLSAVNKFLTRSGIRKKTEIVRTCKKKCGFPSKPDVVRYKENKDSRAACFSEVILYLKSKGYLVIKDNYKNMFYTDAEYRLNNKPISKIKLLLLANRLRTEDKKPIFILDFM